MRKVAIALVLVLAALPFAGSSATNAATVRLPSGAADWATFTPSERAAAYAYEAEVYARVKAAGKLVVQTYSVRAVPLSAAEPAATLVTGYGQCGFNVTQQQAGTWTSAWATTTTTTAVGWIDTGVYNSQRDLFFRGGSQLAWFMAGGQLNSTYVFASSSANFKWWFEQAQYTVQSWHTAGASYSGPYVLGPAAYCSLNVSV